LKHRFWFIAIVLLGLSLSPQAGQAQANISLEIQAGFDSLYKMNVWAPIRVTLTNRGPDLQAQLRVTDDNSAFGAAGARYVYPVDLPGQSRKQFTLYAPLRGQNRLTVELVDPAGDLLHFEQSNVMGIGEEGFLIGVVASNPSLLNGLARFRTPGEDAHEGQVAVAHLDLEDLPEIPQAWAGLDMLVFNDIDTSQLSPAQQAVLQSWTRQGGRLVVGGGPNAAQTIQGLTALLPFASVEVQTLAHPITSLQPFSSRRLENRGPYIAAIPVNSTGQILVKEANRPLIILTRRGAGQVYYSALDLSLAPLDRLAGDPLFMPRLVGAFRPRPEDIVERYDRNLIRNSLGLVPDQLLPTPAAVILYLVAYILVIGPVNYFALSRLKHREWAWFTVPAIILLFSSYSYFSSFRLRGGRPLVRQIMVMQGETGAALAEMTAFIGVYTPQRAEYALEIDRPVLVESLPDSYTLTSGITVIGQNSTVIEDLQGDIGGLPGIIARGHTPLPQITANLSYNQASQQARGVIINHTNQPISDALLVVGDQVVQLGDLPVGETQVNQTAALHDPYGNFYERLNYSYSYSDSDAYDDKEMRELLRLTSRDMALRAIFNSESDSDASPNLEQIYLVGWQEGSLLGVNLTNSSGDTISETVLLLRVPILSQ
jgi:hypothetical protein